MPTLSSSFLPDNSPPREDAPEVLIIHVTPPDTLSASDVAAAIGVSTRWLRTLQKRGVIRAIKVGARGVVYTRHEVERYLRSAHVPDTEEWTVGVGGVACPRLGVQLTMLLSPPNAGAKATEAAANHSLALATDSLRIWHMSGTGAVPIMLPRSVVERALLVVSSWNPARATQAWYLLGLLSSTAVRQGKRTGWRLSSRRLRQEIGRYTEVLEPLIAAKIVAVGRSYHAENFSKRFHLDVHGWKKSPLAAVYVHPETEAKIRAHRPAPKPASDEPSPKAPNVAPVRSAPSVTTGPLAYLQTHYGHTELDAAHALRLIVREHDLSAAMTRRYASDFSLEGLLLLSRKLAGCDSAQSGVLSVFKWLTDRQPLTRDLKVRRVHSAVSNLHAAYRPALRLHGSDRLVTLDLKGSQLWLAACEMAKDDVGQTEDGRRFIDICVEADPYAEFYNLAYGRVPSPTERVDYKRTFFKTVYYAKKKTQREDEAAQWFREGFPNVHAYILHRKLTSYRAFPIAMQRKESSIFIDAMVPLFEEARVPLVTVHDSVIVHAEHADIAETFMLRALEPCGLRPTIKRECLWML